MSRPSSYALTISRTLPFGPRSRRPLMLSASPRSPLTDSNGCCAASCAGSKSDSSASVGSAASSLTGDFGAGGAAQATPRASEQNKNESGQRMTVDTVSAAAHEALQALSRNQSTDDDERRQQRRLQPAGDLCRPVRQDHVRARTPHRDE